MIIYLLCLLLFFIGIYCILRKRNIIKIIVGIIISEYAVNLFFVLTAYRKMGRSPIYTPDVEISNMVDPCQRFVSVLSNKNGKMMLGQIGNQSM